MEVDAWFKELLKRHGAAKADDRHLKVMSVHVRSTDMIDVMATSGQMTKAACWHLIHGMLRRVVDAANDFMGHKGVLILVAADSPKTRAYVKATLPKQIGLYSVTVELTALVQVLKHEQISPENMDMLRFQHRWEAMRMIRQANGKEKPRSGFTGFYRYFFHKPIYNWALATTPQCLRMLKGDRFGEARPPVQGASVVGRTTVSQAYLMAG